MALFKLFKRDQEVYNEATRPTVQKDEPIANAEVSAAEDQPSTNSNSVSNNHLTVSYATGWPIDILYGYMQKNYEQKGYDDAMLNSNLVFRDMNMSIIRNKVLLIFREIKVNYESMRQDIESRIETCNAAGLLTTVVELEKKMSIILSHIAEIKRLEEDFRNNANEASVPLMSYECGFLRGISTIAMTAPIKNTPILNDSADTAQTKSSLSA